ncbi:MAG: DUF6659 family protein [Nitrososphaerales archaeon]
MDDYNELCRRIFTLNPDVRFAGVISSGGKLVAGGMREGLKPLEDELHEKRWFNQIAIRREMRSMFDDLFGKVHFTFVEREKVKQLTLYVGNDIVVVSLGSEVSARDTVDIASAILELIGTK